MQFWNHSADKAMEEFYVQNMFDGKSEIQLDILGVSRNHA